MHSTGAHAKVYPLLYKTRAQRESCLGRRPKTDGANVEFCTACTSEISPPRPLATGLPSHVGPQADPSSSSKHQSCLLQSHRCHCHCTPRACSSHASFMPHTTRTMKHSMSANRLPLHGGAVARTSPHLAWHTNVALHQWQEAHTASQDPLSTLLTCSIFASRCVWQKFSSPAAGMRVCSHMSTAGLGFEPRACSSPFGGFFFFSLIVDVVQVRTSLARPAACRKPRRAPPASSAPSKAASRCSCAHDAARCVCVPRCACAAAAGAAEAACKGHF